METPLQGTESADLTPCLGCLGLGCCRKPVASDTGGVACKRKCGVVA